MKKFIKLTWITAGASLALLILSFLILDKNKVEGIKNEFRNQEGFYLQMNDHRLGLSVNEDGLSYSNGSNMGFNVGNGGFSMHRRMNDHHNKYSGNHMGPGMMRGSTRMEGPGMMRGHMSPIYQNKHPVQSLDQIELEGVNTNFLVSYHDQDQILVEIYSQEEELEIKDLLEDDQLEIDIRDGSKGAYSTAYIYLPEKFDPDIDVESQNGQIYLEAGGRIKAHTNNGNIEILAASRDIEFGTSNGSVIINYQDNDIKGESVNGSINIRKSLPLDARLDLSSINGYVEIDGQGQENSKNFVQKLASGKNTIEIKTINGSIVIE